MKIIIVAFSCVFMGVFFKAQKFNKINCVSYYDTSLNDTIFTKLDKYPTYIGGNPKLSKFILNNLELTYNEKILGGIHIYFVVNEKGKVISAGVKKYTLEYETIDIKIKKLFEGTDNWLPGKCNNDIVTGKVSFPIVW